MSSVIHGLTVVTRNRKDFSSTGVKVINPFQTSATWGRFFDVVGTWGLGFACHFGLGLFQPNLQAVGDEHTAGQLHRLFLPSGQGGKED